MYNYSNENKLIYSYIETITLPNLIAFTIYILYKNSVIINSSYKALYNSVKSLINITNENEVLINFIVLDILKNKYNLKILCYDPLEIKKEV